MRPQSCVSAIFAVVIALFIGPGVRAQEASPTAGALSILQAYEDAWSSGDAAQVVALYRDEAIRDDVPTRMTSEGRAEIEAFAANLFANDDDVRIDVTDSFSGEDWAVAEWTFSGVHPVTRAEVTFRGVAVLELKDGLISREADYYDLPQMQEQTAAANATPTS
jgi:steroid delta-isomerase-like uncharacterized protein